MPVKSTTVAKTSPKKTTTTRKRRTRKVTSIPKVAPLNTTVAKTIVSETVKVQPKVEAKVETKSLKDYPRDGLSLVLLPVLYLEAFVKEIIKELGSIK